MQLAGSAQSPAAGSAASPPTPELGQLPLQELESLANEVFAARRRIVELETENRNLKMQVTSAAPGEPPVPQTPETGFAFGIVDAAGRREVVVPRNVVKLGKHPSRHVLLEGARQFHAVIERDEAGVSIIDMGTTEGTLVNGKPITKTKLSSGDRLEMADAQLVVVFGPE
ncbi:MAG: FHA domain-containing protein [Deltaproteobacteria bacterium]|nr:FHA domain-containing protein [Deltaproteobacteria bacterium]